jgi:hypothetical protein
MTQQLTVDQQIKYIELVIRTKKKEILTAEETKLLAYYELKATQARQQSTPHK